MVKLKKEYLDSIDEWIKDHKECPFSEDLYVSGCDHRDREGKKVCMALFGRRGDGECPDFTSGEFDSKKGERVFDVLITALEENNYETNAKVKDCIW